jgi:hypothetical protein
MLFAVFFFSSMKKVRILSLYCLEIAGIQKNSGIDRIFLLLKFLQSVLISVCIAWLRRPSLPTHSLFLILFFRPTLDVLCVNANFSAKFLSNSVLESKNLILNILLFGPHPAIQNWFNQAFEKPANSWQISDLTCCSFAWFSTLLSDC